MKLVKLMLVATAGLALAAATNEDDVADLEGSPKPGPGRAPAPAPAPAEGHIRHFPAPRGDGNAPGTSTTGPDVAGCTDPSACNFDENANEYDGSCTFPATNQDCTGLCLKTAPADCKGICGGNSNCDTGTGTGTDGACPATCFFLDATGVGLTCDDVGTSMAPGSTSCAELEEAGCSCTGCSCGETDDGYEIFNGMEAVGTVCDKSFKVGQPCTAKNTCTAAECKQECSSVEACAFAGWNTQGGCLLYSSCKNTLTAASVTTTFEQQDVACSCDWWSCVNDGGLGYCA